MRAPLAGFWHKHYYDARSLPRNLLNETERMVKDGRWEEIFAPYYGKLLQEVAGEITVKMVDGAYHQRAAAQRLTGDFIVYEKRAGLNYYLTLGIHGEWEQIRKRVDECKGFDIDGGW